MSVSGISSSSFLNSSNPSVQNESAWQQQFQQLEQELRSGQLSTAGQTTASTELAALQSPPATPASAGTQSSVSPQPVGPARWQDTQSGGGAHSHIRHHFRVDAGNDNTSTQDADQLAQLGQSLQPGNSSVAQQAYSSWQRDLQQVALNGDLIHAQSAALQSSGVSLTA